MSPARTSTATPRAGTKRAIATEAWRQMLDYLFFRQVELGVKLRDLGLTPGHMKALFTLDPSQPRPMGALSDSLQCDASMATWLVDRLEEHGLAERQPLPSDRRVRTIVLTPSGVKARAELLELLYTPPDDLVALDRATLDHLLAAFEELPSHPAPFSQRAGLRSATS